MRVIQSTSIFFLIILILFNNAFTAESQSGKIENFERGLQDTTRRASSPTHHENYSNESDDTTFGEWLVAEMTAFVAIGLWWTVGWVPEETDDLYDGEQPRLAAFPYQGKYSGLYAYPDTLNRTRLWAITGSADYLIGTKSLTGSSLSLRLFPLPYFDFNYSHSTLHEDTSGGTDRINLDSYMLNYRRFRWPTFDFYWGMGVRTIARREYYSGLAFDAGFDLFATKPVSISYLYTGSTIRSNWVSEHQTTLRWHWKRLAARGGYRTWQVGGAGLSGWSLGLEAFF